MSRVLISDSRDTTADDALTLELTNPPRMWIDPQGWNPPVPVFENTYAESADSEGKQRTKTVAKDNPTGSFSIWISADDEETFQNRVDEFQEIVASVHKLKGSLLYEPGDNGQTVTYEIEAITIKDFPQIGSRQEAFVAKIDVEFESLPFGLLEPVEILSGYLMGAATDYVDLDGIDGHVDARAELTILENTTSATARQHIEVAVDDEFDPTVLLDDLEHGTTFNWSSSSPAAYLTSGATISNSTEQAKTGSRSIKTVTGGTTAHGQGFAIYQPFIAGRTYTISFWIKNTAGTGNIEAYFGNSSGSSAVTTGQFAPPSDWTQKTMTWTVTGFSVFVAYLVIRNATAAAKTWYVDVVEGDVPNVSVQANSMNPSGYAGASNTRSGSYSINVLRATLTSSAPVVVCATPPLQHVGLRRIRCRMYGSAGGIRVRLAWQVGDGPIQRERWVTLERGSDWFDPLLGTIDIAELASGHSWTGYIEAQAESGAPTLDVDQIGIMPGKRWGASRMPLSDVVTIPNAFTGRDEFEQTAGNLTGKTAPSGQTWVGTGGDGSAVDYTIETTLDKARRISAGDTEEGGRYCGLGLTLTDTIVRADLSAVTSISTVKMRHMIAARFVDASNVFRAGLLGEINPVTGNTTMATWIVEKRSGGSTTRLETIPLVDPWPEAPAAYTAHLQVYSTGFWMFFGGPVGTELQLIATGWESELTAGQALDDGDARIYNSVQGSNTTSYFDNFVVGSVTPDAALFADRNARFLHDSAFRQNSSGSKEGRVPDFVGKHLTIPPSTSADRPIRLMTKVRNLNVDAGLPDVGGESQNTLNDLVVVPRVLLTGS